tara:strand:- start:175 stop:390 length:216 start_codon:yes stop_codon:yes gene_type:complete
MSSPMDDYHMTLAEIAKELGVSRQTVSVIEKQALAKIKKQLGEWHDEQDSYSNSVIDNLSNVLGSNWIARL